MALTEWLALVSVCFLGAISPGPSLFVILRASIHGGRGIGVITGITHAIAVGIYAIGAIVVLSGVMAIGGMILALVQVLGIAWLLKLSWGLWNASEKGMDVSVAAGIRDGFLIAFLNPKMLAFFLALFAPFVYPGMAMERNFILVATPAVIDGLWYSLAALVLSAAPLRARLLDHSRGLNRAMAIVLTGLAVSLSVRLIQALW